jgi:hypothetical protein
MTWRTMFTGSAIDGCDRDVAEWLGLEVPETLFERLQDLLSFHGLQELIEQCPSGRFEIDEQIDDAGPGLSDTYWRVTATSTTGFKAELKEAVCESLKIPVPPVRARVRKLRPSQRKKAVGEELEAPRRKAALNPNDVAAHLAYAKALEDRGDPLGPLIARMCRSGNPTRVPRDLEDRLLGRLKPAARTWSIERGFLRHIELRRLGAKECAALVGEPLLEGLRSIKFDNEPPPQVVHLIKSIEGLSRVENLTETAFLALLAEPVALDWLSVSIRGFGKLDLPPTPSRLKVRHLVIKTLMGLGRSEPRLCNESGSLMQELESITFDEFYGGPGIADCWLTVEAPKLTKVSNRTVEAKRTLGGRWHVVLEPFRGENIASNVRLYLSSVPGSLAALGALAGKLTLRVPRFRPKTLAPMIAAARKVGAALDYVDPAEELTAAGL